MTQGGARFGERPLFRHFGCEASVKDRCYSCKQELIDIENDGLRLAGCLTCNLWVPHDGDQWVRLSEKKISEPFTRCDTGGLDRRPMLLKYSYRRSSGCPVLSATSVRRQRHH